MLLQRQRKHCVAFTDLQVLVKINIGTNWAERQGDGLCLCLRLFLCLRLYLCILLIIMHFGYNKGRESGSGFGAATK